MSAGIQFRFQHGMPQALLNVLDVMSTNTDLLAYSEENLWLNQHSLLSSWVFERDTVIIVTGCEMLKFFCLHAAIRSFFQGLSVIDFIRYGLYN